jgi:hypothetical protein
MAVYGVPEGRDRRLGRRPVAGIPGRPSGALAIVVLARFPVSAQNRHAGLAFIAALRGNLLYFPVFSASLHCRLAWQSPVFPCFFCKDEKHAARGRTRGRATKKTGAACRPGSWRSFGEYVFLEDSRYTSQAENRAAIKFLN